MAAQEDEQPEKQDQGEEGQDDQPGEGAVDGDVCDPLDMPAHEEVDKDDEQDDEYDDDYDPEEDAYLNTFINKDSMVSNWASGSSRSSRSKFVLIISSFTETSQG